MPDTLRIVTFEELRDIDIVAQRKSGKFIFASWLRYAVFKNTSLTEQQEKRLKRVLDLEPLHKEFDLEIVQITDQHHCVLIKDPARRQFCLRVRDLFYQPTFIQHPPQRSVNLPSGTRFR